MKLVLMQNNSEQVLDGFIRGKLENTAPDMILLDNSFKTFLLERKDKKKNRRWFFWLFLLLPLFVIPMVYFVVSTKSDLPKSNQDINAVSAPVDPKNAGSSLNTKTDGQTNSPESAFVKRTKIGNSIQHAAADKNTIKDVDKLQQNKFNGQPGETQNNNRDDKTLSADSAISSSNTSRNNVIKAIDSIMKNKDKSPAKADTFYIVW